MLLAQSVGISRTAPKTVLSDSEDGYPGCLVGTGQDRFSATIAVAEAKYQGIAERLACFHSAQSGCLAMFLHVGAGCLQLNDAAA